MSILNIVADPAAAVVVTAIVGYVAHELGTLKIGKSTLGADVEKEWPLIKAAVTAAEPVLNTLATDVPALKGVVTELEAKVAAAAPAPDLAPAIQAEVTRQVNARLAALAAPSA